MRLTLIDESEVRERWFPFDEDTEVLIRCLNRGELIKISTKAMKAAKLAPGGGERDYFNCLLGRRAVGGWRKKEDHDHPGLVINNEPFPFNQTNVDLLMSKSIQFSLFVNERCTDAELFGVEDEEEIKNA